MAQTGTQGCAEMVAAYETPVNGNSSAESGSLVSTTPSSLVEEPSSGVGDICSVLQQDDQLEQLFAENIFAKVYRTASMSLQTAASHSDDQEQTTLASSAQVPRGFPECVPQSGTEAGRYTLREAEFWTCGFFPGAMYSLLERCIRFPQSLRLSTDTQIDIATIRADLQMLCNIWSEPLHAMASRTDTHDVGFIVMPSLRLSWELTGDKRSLDSILRAADSLATRYVPAAKAIRSWNGRNQKNIQISTMHDNLILIIDSMCNLDLLYYAAAHSGKRNLADIATAHATTLLNSHLRPEPMPSRGGEHAYAGQWYSTHHVANLDPTSGEVKGQFTAQGYSDSSTWARGQAWGILGYAQTYLWTKDRKFLQAACGLAEFFVHLLESTSEKVEGGRLVPLWDFDAPPGDDGEYIRDSSAGVIAANGMLVLSQALLKLDEDLLAGRFRRLALSIVRDTLDFALAPEARFVTNSKQQVEVEEAIVGQSTFEAILKHGTANNNENSWRRYADHGVVYGDYYLIEFGNRLLMTGLT